MSNLIIDSPLLACPNPINFPAEEFEDIFLDYLQGISDVSKLRANCKSVKVWHDRDLSAVLHEEKCYPFRHALLPAFNVLSIDVDFQLQDINVLAMSLLEKTLCFEEIGAINDVAVTECEMIVDVISERSKNITDHLCRQISLALPLLGDGKIFNANTYLASKVFKKDSPDVKVEYLLELIECTDGTCIDVNIPARIEISNFHSIDTLLKRSDLSSWWASGHENAAIDALCIAVAREGENPFEEIALLRSRFTFGKEFFPSAQKHGFMHDHPKISKLLRACSDLAVGRNLANSHALRTGRGGDDPQRTRGDWKAWRHDVDYEFHIHYWKNGSDIEVSNLVVHNDFCIF